MVADLQQQPVPVQFTASQIGAMTRYLRRMYEANAVLNCARRADGIIVVEVAGCPWLWDPDQKKALPVPPDEVDYAWLALTPPQGLSIIPTDSYSTALHLHED